MSSILLAYSTTDGHTAHICERLRQVIEEQGHSCKVVLLTQADSLDLAAFDSIVIGASIRYGKHQPAVAQFIGRHQALLERKANAFFSVNIVARKPEKNRPDTNPYLIKYLKTIAWKPRHLDVFAGRIDFPSLGWGDRTMIRFIMWVTKGPTDPTAVVEFTDWARVEEFGRVVAQM